MDIPPSRPVREECPVTLRHLFNELRIIERAELGELTVRPHGKKKPHPSDPAYQQPPTTISHFVEYVDDIGRVLAMAHYYERPDRFTMPDPKWLLTETEILIAPGAPGHRCPICAPDMESE
jgi:hypothetical protein